MIKVNELRIGNSVLHEGKVLTVHALSENEIGVYENMFGSRYYPEESYDPIFLTEDWILKLGFEPIPDKNGSLYKKDYRFVYFFNTDNPHIMFEYDQFDINKSTRCVYSVHELMNLWYWLTGSELTLNK